MHRYFTIVVAAAAALLLGAGDALAQQPARWLEFPIAPDWRGPGFYFSWLKILMAWSVFLAWVGTADWVSRDLRQWKKLDYRLWNPIIVGSFFAALLLMLVIPSFAFGFTLLLLAYGGPLGAYVFLRNKNCEEHEKVFTPAHIRFVMASLVNRLGGKMATEKADPRDAGPPVKFLGRGAASAANNARAEQARNHPGIRHARQLVADALDNRATALMIDFIRDSAVLRYMIDGVWVNRDAENRETAIPALDALKILCGLKPEDRVSRQEGKFIAEYKDAKLQGACTTVGTQTGERALVQFEEAACSFKGFDELGMRDKMRDQLGELLEQPKGIVLFAAMPASGLRSTMDVALRRMDRLMRDFVAVEDEGNPYASVENVPLTTYKAAAGETPMTVLPKLARTEPNVFVVRDLVNGETGEFLCKQAQDGRMVVASIRAKDGADALLRVLALGTPPVELAKAVHIVLSQRLARRLCPKCKEAYAPTPELLQQLGIPEGRVKCFYRAYKPPLPKPGEKAKKEEICPECQGIGYKGRIAFFELLVAGETTRRALASSPKAEILRAAARKDGALSLQDEGLMLVVKGVTSLEELTRVMKQ